MIIEKITYNKGKAEGYFIKTGKGYVKITIQEGELFNLREIKKQQEIRINEVTLKVEEIPSKNNYIN